MGSCCAQDSSTVCPLPAGIASGARPLYLPVPSCRLCVTILAPYSVESTGLSNRRDFLFHGPEPGSSEQNLGVSLFHKLHFTAEREHLGSEKQGLQAQPHRAT